MVLGTKEMDKLVHLWEFHRDGCGGCENRKDVKIEQRCGGGIGTVTVFICGCGREVDITDYHSW